MLFRHRAIIMGNKDVICMKISTKGRYALEAITYMGSLPPGQPLNIKALAEKTCIPQRYLEQIFFILRKAAILETRRGPTGGYLLAVDRHVLTAGDVVRAAEGELLPVACLAQEGICGNRRYDSCATRPLWQQMSDAVDRVLDQVTVAQLADCYRATGVEP